MAIQVKLVRSLSGHTKEHRATVHGLGLLRINQTRIVQDTPATRGMVETVGYLLEVTETKEPFKPFGRRFLAKKQAADAAAAAAAAKK